MNAQYAKKGRYYDDSRGIQQAAEAVAGTSLDDFFSKYVHGTQEIPYNDFFQWVGLKVEPFTILETDAGFDANVNFTGLPEVVSITPGSEVEAAGVRVGDVVTAINGEEYLGDLETLSCRAQAGRDHLVSLHVARALAGSECCAQRHIMSRAMGWSTCRR